MSRFSTKVWWYLRQRAHLAHRVGLRLHVPKRRDERVEVERVAEVGDGDVARLLPLAAARRLALLVIAVHVQPHPRRGVVRPEEACQLVDRHEPFVVAEHTLLRARVEVLVRRLRRLRSLFRHE